jgi:hypothetical protein
MLDLSGILWAVPRIQSRDAHRKISYELQWQVYPLGN